MLDLASSPAFPHLLVRLVADLLRVLVPALAVEFLAVLQEDSRTLLRKDREFTHNADFDRASLFGHRRTPSLEFGPLISDGREEVCDRNHNFWSAWCGESDLGREAV